MNEAVRDVIGGLGGLDGLVKPGDRVLLKPYLAPATSSEAGTSAAFVASVGRAVQECGGSVYIGDSPILPTVPIQSLWNANGLSEVARRCGFELISFERTGSEPLAVDTRVYYVSRAVRESDLVINLPRFRRDRWTGFAGAIANMFGIIPGFQKGRLFAVDFSTSEIARLLVDAYSLATPALTVIDGTSPNDAGENVEGFMGAAFDGIALDTVLASVLGFKFDSMRTIRLASEAGLGIGWLEGIRQTGDPLTARELEPLLKSRGLQAYFPSAMARLISPLMKVTASVEGSNCDGCGLCAEVCPTHAVQLEAGEQLPSFRKPLCIDCGCCHSNCPSRAIRLKASYFAETFFQS